jgi:hypothetical protein
MNKVPRRGLSRTELVPLAVFVVASGEWEDRGIRRIEAFDAISSVCKILSSSEDIDSAVDRMALSCQNNLMAFRRTDFESIQGEPPFRPRAIENLKSLAKSWLAGGEAAILERFTTLFTDRNPSACGGHIVRIISGTGLTIDSPVKFSDCPIEVRSKSECWFMNYTFGYENEDWYRGSHRTTYRNNDGILISLWEISTADGKGKCFYFDTNWV